MQHKIYLYTKFIGLPQTNAGYPKIKKDFFETDNYLEFLFSEQRISSRLIFFKELTLKSILNQTYYNFEWIIYISNFLPQIYKDYINNIDDRIKVIEVTGEKIYNSDLIKIHVPEETNYISCRLDDDDALCSDYFENLNRMYDANKQVIGSKNFLCVTHKKESFFYSQTKKPWLISAGLSCKNSHIYSIGSHVNASNKYSYDVIFPNSYPCIQSGGDHTFTNRKHESSKLVFNMELYLNNKYNYD